MFETLIQQSLNWEGGVVFIPLAFGLAVGLIKYVFMIVSVLVVYLVGALLIIDYFPR